jgi:hypothetical protein
MGIDIIKEEKMKKLFMVLCVVIMFFAIVSCNEDNTTSNLNTSKKSITTPIANQQTGDSTFATPEPATLLLLGAGMMGLAGVGRKKLFKKDQDE